LQTFSLPDGSIVKLVDVASARVTKHFWSDKFYVEIEFRNGSTRDVVEHLPREAADMKQAEIVAMIRQAWEEVEPYQHGFHTGYARGKVEGLSEGLEQGRTQGYQSGFETGRGQGHADGRRSILSPLIERRETMISEESNSAGQTPSQRRYRRNAISVLTDIIQNFSPEPSSRSAD